MKKIKLPLPQSGGLVLSYKCTAACKHCMYFYSPGWEADWIKDEDLRHCLSLLPGKISSSPWGSHSISLNHGLHFTGGEPFLNYELLWEYYRRGKAGTGKGKRENRGRIKISPDTFSSPQSPVTTHHTSHLSSSLHAIPFSWQ